MGPRFGGWILVKVFGKLLEAGLVRSVTTPHQLISLIILEFFLTKSTGHHLVGGGDTNRALMADGNLAMTYLNACLGRLVLVIHLIILEMPLKK
jgi:hypothetical protein